MSRSVLLILAVALLGCSSTVPQFDGAWRIEDVNGGGVIDRSRLEITFVPDGGMYGQSGCNSFTGRYALDGASVDIGPLASTKRVCAAEALMLQEARMLHALDSVATASLEADGALVLTGPPPTRLLLRRMDAAPAPIAVSGEAAAGDVDRG